jgi:hypothetical protein
MLLSIYQNQQSMADFRAIALRGLVNGRHLCKPDFTEPASCQHIDDRTYFRTPSPYGQLALFCAELPVFFRHKLLIWQEIAQCSQLRKRELCIDGKLSSVCLKKETGGNQCHLQIWAKRPTGFRLKHHFLQSLVARRLQHVGTQAAIKRYLVAQQALVSRLLQAQARLKGRLLARLVTLFTAKQTQENATKTCDAKAQRLNDFALPCVKLRHLVVSAPQWAKTAQLRGILNETSNLHYCSGSHIFGQRLHESRRGIQSRRNLAVGPVDGRLTKSRATACLNNHIALSVPHQRGGFLRFPIQIPSSQIQKDIPCSTRS